jgi:nicotinamide phosphoribosyltransferase
MKETFMLKKIQTQKASLNRLGYNLILDADSYKLSHWLVYPELVRGMFSYIEPRRKGKLIVPFGMQMWVRKCLLDPITTADVDEAEEFAIHHMVPFNRSDWDYIVEKYQGFLPVVIRAVKEGMIMPSSNAIVTVECTDHRLFWLASYIETTMQRGVWYPTTIASNDREKYDLIAKAVRRTCDDAFFNVIMSFSLHDFAGRGVTCEEQAQIGGAAHTVFFRGSDTVSGVRAANFFYNEQMAAFSVPATEHSIQTAYGPDGQEQYIAAILDAYAKNGAILSLVVDGYNVFRECELLCTKFKQRIIDSGAKVVFRPDSGDPVAIIDWLLDLLEKHFGTTINTKGYKVLNHVGIIQGDGINYEMIAKILNLLEDKKFAASTIVYGSGGDLLQNAKRDDLSFAQKASAIQLKDGSWIDIFKDPITDPGKKSKAGRLTTVRSRLTGEWSTLKVGEFADEFEDMMWTIYDHGTAPNTLTLEQIRRFNGIVPLGESIPEDLGL